MSQEGQTLIPLHCFLYDKVLLQSYRIRQNEIAAHRQQFHGNFLKRIYTEQHISVASKLLGQMVENNFF